MQPEFRKVIADGDLLLQQRGRWWPIYGDKWENYRNESEEVRLLKHHMDTAFMKYKELQHLFTVAQKNVQTDMQLLQMHKVDNSEVEYLIPHELSILEERDGIKYKSNNGNNGKGGGNGGGSNQNQNQNQNNGQGNNNQNQSKKQKGQQNKPVSLMDLIINGRIVLPNQQQQVS